MPASLDQDFCRSRNETSAKVVDIPIPDPIPNKLRIGVLPGSNRIVNKTKFSAEASDTSPHTRSVIFRSRRESPSSGRLVVLGRTDPER